ncbi:MAG: ribonuclease E inhibitor RraB [Planctomycetes bacterium]|nr:ribonuclease E inhibitor RraB [Planctomycetota bacterium]
MICNIENLLTAFEGMISNGWDVESEMKWGYCFYDKNEENLKNAYEVIKDRDYALDSLVQDEEDEYWKLYITKIEIHTPDSLNQRNEAMNRLADNFGIELYDGWDVERLS